MSNTYHDLSGLANSPVGAAIQAAQQYVVPGQWAGMVKPGNINLNARPVVHNPDGSISTVKSISYNVGGHEVLMPEVVGGRVVSPHQALLAYLRTGQHLGMFTTPAAADAYAQALHLEQAARYGRG